MVTAKIRIRLTTKRRTGGQSPKICVEKLKEEETRLQYQVEVENIFAALEAEEDISWSQVKPIIIEAAEGTVGRARRQRGGQWFDGECREAACRRRKTRMKWLENREKYRDEKDISRG